MMPWSRDKTFAADTVIPPNFLNRCQNSLILGINHVEIVKTVHASAFRVNAGSATYANGRLELLAGGGCEVDCSCDVEADEYITGVGAFGEVVLAGNEFHVDLHFRDTGGAENQQEHLISPTSVGVHDVSNFVFSAPPRVGFSTTWSIRIVSPNTNAGSIYLYSARFGVARPGY